MSRWRDRWPRLVLVDARTLPVGRAVRTNTGVLICSSFLLAETEWGDRACNWGELQLGLMTEEEWKRG